MYAGKPGSPGVPEAEKVGKTYVDLKWDKPRNDGGSKITGTVIPCGHDAVLSHFTIIT